MLSMFYLYFPHVPSGPSEIKLNWIVYLVTEIKVYLNAKFGGDVEFTLPEDKAISILVHCVDKNSLIG